MSINSPRQLKDWLRNKEKKDGIPGTDVGRRDRQSRQ